MATKKAAKKARERASASKGGRKAEKPDENIRKQARKSKSENNEVEQRPTKKFKFPKSLSACVDKYDELKERRLAIQKQAQEVAEEESAYRQHLIDNISKSDAAGVIGKAKRAVVLVEPVPTIEDEVKFMKFARKKGNEDLVVERPNMKAISDRWEAGKVIPGVGKFNVVKLSLKKI